VAREGLGAEIDISMKDEAKKRLKQLLGAYDEKLAERDRVDAAIRAAKEAFPERFTALKKKTILPLLQELADELNASGHEATFREQEESASTSGGVTAAAVLLRIVPRPFAQRSAETKKSFLEITFAANRNEQKIVVSSSNTIINSGGSVGKRGEYAIEAVNDDVVIGHVMHALEEAFAGK
jgi:hypothetical protein